MPFIEHQLPTRTLEYGSTHRWSRRRVLRSMALMLVGGVVLAGWRWRGAVQFRVAQYYWFHQAMAHVTPPNTVLLESDAIKAKALYTTNPEYFDQSKYVPLDPVSASPPKFTTDRPIAIYVPTAVRQLEPYLETKSDLLNEDDAVVFVGERRTPAGERRLVIIRGALPLEGMLTRLQGVVAAPPTMTQPAQVLNGPFNGADFSGKAFLAIMSPGVADPADPTHIIISYQDRTVTATGGLMCISETTIA